VSFSLTAVPVAVRRASALSVLDPKAMAVMHVCLWMFIVPLLEGIGF